MFIFLSFCAFSKKDFFKKSLHDSLLHCFHFLAVLIFSSNFVHVIVFFFHRSRETTPPSFSETVAASVQSYAVPHNSHPPLLTNRQDKAKDRQKKKRRQKCLIMNTFALSNGTTSIENLSFSGSFCNGTTDNARGPRCASSLDLDLVSGSGSGSTQDPVSGSSESDFWEEAKLTAFKVASPIILITGTVGESPFMP